MPLLPAIAEPCPAAAWVAAAATFHPPAASTPPKPAHRRKSRRSTAVVSFFLLVLLTAPWGWKFERCDRFGGRSAGRRTRAAPPPVNAAVPCTGTNSAGRHGP